MELTIALAKGRLAEKAVELLTKCGVDCANILNPTRQLVLYDTSGQFRFLFVKPSDVPTYVEYGVADLGFVGKDTLLEEDKELYELLDLRFGQCKLCLAGKREDAKGITTSVTRVATKYVNIAKKYFSTRGEVEIIKLNGSVELGPIVGLSDIILDIVESGKTLKANNLEVKKEIFDISARLVANKVSYKKKGEMIKPLVSQLKELIEQEK